MLLPSPRPRLSLRHFAALGGWLILAFCAAPASAQELRREPIPFTVWLDFRALSRPNPQIALPVWLESIVSEHPRWPIGDPHSTIFRLRFRRLGALNKELHLRLFFDDDPAALPTVSGWTETGVRRYCSGPLGTGLGLPNSAGLLLPTEDLDYVEIAVNNDGHTIHGAFLSTATPVQTRAALDFAQSPEFLDPFGRPPMSSPQTDDSYLFGRVRAALLAEAVKLSPLTPVVLDFQIDQPPLLAVVSFDVLNVDLAAAPEVMLDGLALGASTFRLPDLADPALRGEVLPRQAEVRYHYSGWLHCEKIVPSASLTTGVHRLVLLLGSEAQPVAVRAVEIQLKYPWEGAVAP